MPHSSHDAASHRRFVASSPAFFASSPPQIEKGPNPFEQHLRDGLSKIRSPESAGSENIIASTLTSYIHHALDDHTMRVRPSDIYAKIALGVCVRLVAHQSVDVIMHYINDQLAKKR
jgi:hypothetical protein